MRAISVDLPAFGKSDQTDVGDQFQLQPQELLFALLTRLDPARRAIGRRARIARLPRPPRPPCATSTRWPS
jgi:hypothetical protein